MLKIYNNEYVRALSLMVIFESSLTTFEAFVISSGSFGVR